MKGICDEEGCKKPAKYKIQTLGIKLCEQHYKSNLEPQISIKNSIKSVKTTNNHTFTKLESNILAVLQKTCKPLSITQLSSIIPTLNEALLDNALESLIIKDIITVQ